MTHIIIGLAFLMTLSSPIAASAKDILVGGAFECESMQAMRIGPYEEQYESERQQKFTLLVEEQSIRFLSKGYVNSTDLVKKHHQPHLLSAYSDFASFTLERKQDGQRFRFHYVDAMFSRSFVMFGHCRKY